MSLKLYAPLDFEMDMFTNDYLLELNGNERFDESEEYFDDVECKVYILHNVKNLSILDITVYVENSDFLGFYAYFE